MWEAIATVISTLIAKFGVPSTVELQRVMLAFIRQELDVRDLQHALAELARAANTPPAPVAVPDLELGADLGIRHAEHGWFAGERNGAPVWSLDPFDANRYRTIGTAESALVLHGLRGAAGVSIESLPTEQ